MSETSPFMQGDYERIQEVAQVQIEHQREAEIERQSEEIIRQLDGLCDNQSIHLIDPDLAKTVAIKLGVDEESLSNETVSLVKDNKNRERDKGTVEYKTDENGRRVVDLDHSIKSSDFHMSDWRRYLPTNRTGIFIRLNFYEPISDDIAVNLEKQSNMEDYLKQLKERLTHPEAPLAPNIIMDGVVSAREPKSE